MENKISKFTLLLFLLLFPVTSYAGNNWPKLDYNNEKSLICDHTLKIATAHFNSSAFNLYSPFEVPDEVDVIQLTTNMTDISGGNALQADKSAFKKIPKSTQTSYYDVGIYWQMESSHGQRFVVNEDAFGWRGNQYTLFALSENITPQEFMEGYSRNLKKRRFKPIVEENWRPPLFFKETNTNEVWAIHVGAPWISLSHWEVFSIRQDGAKRRCSVHFRSKDKEGIKLLPGELHTLASLLSGTLGSGHNEGTLQPTARIKVNVKHIWTNVALRPWALKTLEPYNGRKQVDFELEKWSKKSKSFYDHYQKIQKQYPLAKKALAKYYETNFSKSPKEAKIMAEDLLDKAFRSYFVFHK